MAGIRLDAEAGFGLGAVVVGEFGIQHLHPFGMGNGEPLAEVVVEGNIMNHNVFILSGESGVFAEVNAVAPHAAAGRKFAIKLCHLESGFCQI